MSLLSRLCCQLLLWLGWVEVCRCDEWLLRTNSDDGGGGEVTSLQWFKLLFVPTLGLVVLSLFMLEDHCYGQHANAADARKRGGEQPPQPQAALEAALHARRRRGDVDLPDPSFPSQLLPAGKGGRGRSASSASHHHSGGCCAHLDKGESYAPLSYSSRLPSSSAFSIASHSPFRSPSSAYPHVLLISEANQATAYSLPPSLPLRDLLLFHSSRHNLTLDPVLVWVDGRAVDSSRMSEPVERLGVVDGSSVRCEMDWKRLVEVMMKEEEREGKERERDAALLRRQRVETQERAQKMEAELAQLISDEQRTRAQFESVAEEREGVAALVRAAEQRLSAATAARQTAEETRRQRERESGSEREKREKARLEEVIAATRKEMGDLSRERGELGQKTRRVKEENEELSGRRRELDVKGDRIEREKEGWRRKVEGGEKGVLERLERAEREKEESGRMKAKMEASEREKDEKRQTKDETHRATTLRIDALSSSIAKQLARLQQAEKDAADSSKFKQLARQYEADVKEAARWKVLVKQGRVREKMMEKEVKELGHWRQRAKAFEREVRQLRSWRREVGRRERRAEGLEGPGWGLEGGAAFDYPGDGSLNGLAGYDGLDDWGADSGPGLSDDLPLRDDEGDEAAIPPVDVITSQALSQSSASSLSSSSRSSYALSGSTLQPTAAPFVPRLNLPLAGHAPMAAVSAFPSTGLYPPYPAWGSQGAAVTLPVPAVASYRPSGGFIGMGEADGDGADTEGGSEAAESVGSQLPR